MHPIRRTRRVENALEPCHGGGGELPSLLRQGQLMTRAAQANGIAGCTAQGFRYVIPSVGLRARW